MTRATIVLIACLLLAPVARTQGTSFTLLFPTLTDMSADNTYCPGVFYDSDGTIECCVGGTMPPIVLSTCAGWPTCTGPVTTTTTNTPISCATVISYTDNSQYASRVVEASKSLVASGTHYQTVLSQGSEMSAGSGLVSNAVSSAASSTASNTAVGTSGGDTMMLVPVLSFIVAASFAGMLFL